MEQQNETVTLYLSTYDDMKKTIERQKDNIKRLSEECQHMEALLKRIGFPVDIAKSYIDLTKFRVMVSDDLDAMGKGYCISFHVDGKHIVNDNLRREYGCKI